MLLLNFCYDFSSPDIIPNAVDVLREVIKLNHLDTMSINKAITLYSFMLRSLLMNCNALLISLLYKTVALFTFILLKLVTVRISRSNFGAN